VTGKRSAISTTRNKTNAYQTRRSAHRLFTASSSNTASIFPRCTAIGGVGKTNSNVAVYHQ
jgi:hypothetical protein